MADSISMRQLANWMWAFGKIVTEQQDYLTKLDAAIGDGDHGTNVARGTKAVITLIGGQPIDAIGPMFKKIGMTLVSSVGGASGPLYGTFFMKFGSSAGMTDVLTSAELAEALRAGLDGIVARGRAKPGDKTMVDVMQPAIETLEHCVAAGTPLEDALQSAADAATKGRDATIPLVARKGRASYLGERSAGHQDPGATSAAYMFETLAETMRQN